LRPQPEADAGWRFAVFVLLFIAIAFDIFPIVGTAV